VEAAAREKAALEGDFKTAVDRTVGRCNFKPVPGSLLETKVFELLSSLAFKCNLRRYSTAKELEEQKAYYIAQLTKVGRCMLNLSNPR